jgi:hypothetical protein
MAERRSLVEQIDPATEVALAVEEEFIYGAKGRPSRLKQEQTPPPSEETVEGKKEQAPAPSAVARVGLTTRIRGDFADALKRASLERQLRKEKPNTQQDILEEALEPWLRKHGYLN